jgi:hypothetical protein
MNELTPARFRRAIRHLPTFKHASVKNIFNIVERRFQDPQNNPPLRIAVFGGSVTIGRGCGENKRAQQDLKCAWPQRFELLVNQFFGKEIIKVYNLGIGGTNSDTGCTMILLYIEMVLMLLLIHTLRMILFHRGLAAHE